MPHGFRRNPEAAFDPWEFEPDIVVIVSDLMGLATALKSRVSP
jgi:hypothetical protein